MAKGRVQPRPALTRPAGTMRYGHLPATQAAAISTESRFYYTGEACSRGHYEPRYTISRNCVFCQRAYAIQRREAAVDLAESARAKTMLAEAEARLAAMAPDHPDVPEAVVDYLVASGADMILPGLLVVNPTFWSPSEVFALMVRAAGKRVVHDGQNGVYFVPAATLAGLPATPVAAAQWRATLEDLHDWPMAGSVRDVVTDGLRAGTASQHRRVLEVWQGKPVSVRGGQTAAAGGL